MQKSKKNVRIVRRLAFMSELAEAFAIIVEPMVRGQLQIPSLAKVSAQRILGVYQKIAPEGVGRIKPKETCKH